MATPVRLGFQEDRRAQAGPRCRAGFLHPIHTLLLADSPTAHSHPPCWFMAACSPCDLTGQEGGDGGQLLGPGRGGDQRKLGCWWTWVWAARTEVAPAQGHARPAPPAGEGQSQEANKKVTGLRSQQVFIKRLQSYWEEAMMLDTPVEREGQRQREQNGRRTSSHQPQCP